MNKRILIIGSIIALILLLVIVVLRLQSKTAETKLPNGSANITPGFPTEVPTTQNTNGENSPALPVEERQKELSLYQKTKPDIFLASYAPFENEFFRITYTLGSDGVMNFVVTSKAESLVQAREAFTSWAQGLGLTAEQINGLRISFQ